jgi:hypothetical protein
VDRGGVKQTVDMSKVDGTPVEHVKIKGGRGHPDGCWSSARRDPIAAFLGR